MAMIETQTTTTPSSVLPDSDDFPGSRFVGRFKLVSQENFDDFLKAIGVNGLKRAITRILTHVYDCSYDRETGYWTVITNLLLGEKVNTFRMGEEKEFITIDGRKTKILTVVEREDKMVYRERWNNDTQEAIYVHEIDGDDLTTTITTGNVCCVQKYKRS